MARGRTFLLNPNRTVTTSAAGGGTTNQVAKFTGAYTIGDSSLADDGTNVTSTANLLFSADNGKDIGAAGATRPRTGYFGTAVAIGTTPASSGALRLANGAEIVYRDQGDTGNVSAVRFTTANILSFGDSASGTVSGIVFNESGADVDIRMESDTNANHFVSDAGAYSGVGAFSFGRTASASRYLIIGRPALTSGATTSWADFQVEPSAAVTLGGSMAHVNTAVFTEPNITLNGNTADDAYTVRIENAPTEGTRNGALWVAAGDSRFDGSVSKKREGGAAATFGIVTLSGSGTAIIYSTAIKTTSAIFLAPMNASGTAGSAYISTSTNLVSATVASTNAADTRDIYWWILNPS